ncbi:hypothetical protein [Parafilimonas terrae]|uniref:Uncharacterized protein n=1 Tax=Parafilimonas terrae TaxID=1465490 RepID=A0A1I5TC67_9BACT|nr:hypothetical protein [Parafilimonas terrae]SFP80026.1 hypothetical protein SAMN05444277_10218 [Parafilimonas terrae]
MNMQKTLEHLSYIIDATDATVKHYDKADLKRVPYFYLGLLERIKASSIGLSVLIQSLNETPESEFSAGLVVRTLILDFFMGLNGYAKHNAAKQAGKSHDEIELELVEFCNRIFADGLRWTINHFKSFRKEDLYNDEQLEKAYAQLTAQYPAFLERTGTDVPKTKYAPPDSNGGLFSALAANNELKELSRNYETYAFYSKYEHFSIMSYSLMRRPGQDQFTTLWKAIELIVLHLYLSTSMLREYLPDGDNYIKDTNEKVGRYIHRNIFGGVA